MSIYGLFGITLVVITLFSLIDAGIAIAGQVLQHNVNRRQDVALLGWTIAGQAPDAGYRLVSMSADAAISQSDWATAAAGFSASKRGPGSRPKDRTGQ